MTGCFAARLREARALLRRKARVDLGVGADRAGSCVGVDHVRVAVEDFANLLTGERADAALGEPRVRRAVRREPEFPADAVDLVRRYAVLRERAHEGVLDRELLGVGERLVVLVGLADVVVDLAERMVAREVHLAGVVLAGRDRLELLDRQVDVCEIDSHFRFSFEVVFCSGYTNVPKRLRRALFCATCFQKFQCISSCNRTPSFVPSASQT